MQRTLLYSLILFQIWRFSCRQSSRDTMQLFRWLFPLLHTQGAALQTYERMFSLRLLRSRTGSHFTVRRWKLESKSPYSTGGIWCICENILSAANIVVYVRGFDLIARKAALGRSWQLYKRVTSSFEIHSSNYFGFRHGGLQDKSKCIAEQSLDNGKTAGWPSERYRREKGFYGA